MAKIKSNQTLSVVIPSLNEANNLPLLLADLQRWSSQLEICICDGKSSDLTILVAELAGAKVLKLLKQNRGFQLHQGACNTKGDWLLFLHADCRMPINWQSKIKEIIQNPSKQSHVWFFDLKIQKRQLGLRFLELAVYIRSHLFKRPYGDQGLLISRSLYKQIGGFYPLPLMEDLDFIERISKEANIKGICMPLYNDGRSWYKTNIIAKAWKNAKLRRRWREGQSLEIIARDYYK